MDNFKLMETRHAVRTYNDKPVDEAAANTLRALIAAYNAQADLHIQLCLDEPQAFKGFMAHYGRFTNVKNYIVMAGKKTSGVDEKIGYYGEKIVLKATELGLSTCWTGMSYSRPKCRAIIAEDEKLACLVALGYSDNPGIPHKSKTIEQVSRVTGDMPEWFRRGIQAALLAPNPMNQQRYVFTLDGDTVGATVSNGFFPSITLGIVKCHFELGASHDGLKWAE